MSTLRVSIESFAVELHKDLQQLIDVHPTGIYLQHLQDMYGESPARINAATHILEEKGYVTKHRSISRAFYILPQNYTLPLPYPELTDLQRRLLLYLQDLCFQYNTFRVRTNYSQLANIQHCSHGGIKSCIHRLAQLHLLTIVSPSQRGKQSELVIQITDPHLDD